MGGVGAWKSFDDIEENITLDELLLMHEVLEKNTRDERMFLAAIQGIDTSDMYEDSGVDSKPVNMTQDEYDKILEADREWKKKKQEALESGEAQQAELSAIGLGYAVSGT